MGVVDRYLGDTHTTEVILQKHQFHLNKHPVIMDVCVCPTLDKGFSTTFSPQAGGRSAIASLLPTKTLAIGSETRPDQSGVPAFNTMTPLVHPAAVSLFPWFFMLPPPNRFSHRRFAADLPLCRRALLLTTICSNIYNCADFPPYRLSHSFPREIALTENPSSKCVLLSRPTRVLSVNPFTGALSHRASTN